MEDPNEPNKRTDHMRRTGLHKQARRRRQPVRPTQAARHDRTGRRQHDGDLLMALVYSDYMIRTRRPDGDQIDINVGDRVNMTLEDAINLAKERVRDYWRQVVAEQPDIAGHRRPAGLDNEEATGEWLES